MDSDLVLPVVIICVYSFVGLVYCSVAIYVKYNVVDSQV